jgi:hypothetical protein
MRTWKILLHLLLTLLLSIGASGVVSAKVASGDQNLTWTGHQAENVFNWLTCQGKSDRSTTGPPECSVVTKKVDDFVDLTGHRKDHILNRHRAGAGKPGKTEFPSNWSDNEILHHVSDIATDPNAVRGVGKWDSPYAVGKRDGIEIRVDFYPNNHPKYSGQISTAYPTNVKPNP